MAAAATVIMPAQCLGCGRGRRGDGEPFAQPPIGEREAGRKQRFAAAAPVAAAAAANHGAKSSSRVYLVTIIVLFSVPPRVSEDGRTNGRLL